MDLAHTLRHIVQHVQDVAGIDSDGNGIVKVDAHSWAISVESRYASSCVGRDNSTRQFANAQVPTTDVRVC